MAYVRLEKRLQTKEEEKTFIPHLQSSVCIVESSQRSSDEGEVSHFMIFAEFRALRMKQHWLTSGAYYPSQSYRCWRVLPPRSGAKNWNLLGNQLYTSQIAPQTTLASNRRGKRGTSITLLRSTVVTTDRASMFTRVVRLRDPHASALQKTRCLMDVSQFRNERESRVSINGIRSIGWALYLCKN